MLQSDRAHEDGAARPSLPCGAGRNGSWKPASMHCCGWLFPDFRNNVDLYHHARDG
jgi:hypothetical protein